MYDISCELYASLAIRYLSKLPKMRCKIQFGGLPRGKVLVLDQMEGTSDWISSNKSSEDIGQRQHISVQSGTF